MLKYLILIVFVPMFSILIGGNAYSSGSCYKIELTQKEKFSINEIFCLHHSVNYGEEAVNNNPDKKYDEEKKNANLLHSSSTDFRVKITGNAAQDKSRSYIIVKQDSSLHWPFEEPETDTEIDWYNENNDYIRTVKFHSQYSDIIFKDDHLQVITEDKKLSHLCNRITEYDLLNGKKLNAETKCDQ